MSDDPCPCGLNETVCAYYCSSACLRHRDADYWRDFYRNNEHTLEPSPFARNLGTKGCSVLELGCGNGRDAYHLARFNKVVGVDAAVKPRDAENVSFVRADVRDYLREHPCTFDVVYTRFFLHSVPEFLEDKILDWVTGLLAVEARTPTDRVKESDHYRRYIHSERFLTKLRDRGYRIIDHRVSRGLAPYGNEDPEILRVVARRDWISK